MLNWFRRAPKTDSVAASGDIEIGGVPWARLSSLPPARLGGFFTVTNKGEVADRLVSAASPTAGRVEIHAIKVVGGNINMRPLADGLAIPPGSTLVLRPRGYHLLFVDLAPPPATGTRVPVTLTFERAGSVEIELAVAEPGLVGERILDEEHHRG